MPASDYVPTFSVVLARVDAIRTSKAEDRQARADLRVGGLSGEIRLKGGVEVRIRQRPPCDPPRRRCENNLIPR